jgi:niacin transporter
MKVREIVWGGLLTSLALIIPLAFGGFLGITLPPFSATIASHVPVMIAMLISPLVAFMVAAGSALGFFLKLGAVIGARAGMHIIFAVLGAYLIKHGRSFKTALLATLPVHAVSEALIVLPFGFTLQKAGVVVGIGTGLHHIIDSLIALSVFALIGYLIPQKGTFAKKL